MKTRLILDINKTQYAQLNSIVMGRVGDKESITVDVRVVDGMIPYSLTGFDVFFECAKPDNTSVRDKLGIKMIDAAKGRFEYTFPVQTFTSIGKSKQAYFSIEKNSTVKATTQDFNIVSIPDALTNRIPSQTYISQLDQLIKDLEAMQLDILNSVAYQEAHDAKIFAEQAKLISESVKAQLDQIVIAGSIDPETKQARVDENGFAYPLLKDRIDALANKVPQEVINARKDLENVIHPNLKTRLDSDAQKVKDLDKKVKKLHVTPEDYGAKGDGVTDDFDAIKNMLDEAGNLVSFGQNKVYLVRTFGFICNTPNIVINGNGSVIKLMDNSGLLERMKNETEKPGENIAFWFNGENVRVKDLNFHANATNNFFMHNGEKYYGYQADLNVPGIPAKYITTYGIQSHVSNVHYENCSFTDFGSGIFLGDFWGEGGILSDFTVDRCIFNSGFRDQVVFFQARDTRITNCKFNNNQRKAIQFYQNASKQKVENCEINVNPAQIRKWHPQWTPSFPDAEMGGIGIQNINYYDSAYNCNDTKIVHVTFKGTKFGITFRNYSKDLIVRDCTFDNAGTGLISLNGMQGVATFENNNIINCDGVGLTMSRHASLDQNITKEYEAYLNIRGNTIVNGGNLLVINDNNNQDLLYKKLTITVEENNIGLNANYIALNTNRTTASKNFVELVQRRNFADTKEMVFTGTNKAIRNLRSNDKIKIMTPFISEKPTQDHNFVKVLTLETTQNLQNVMLKGKIYNNSVADVRYTEFIFMIRTNSQADWDSVINAYTLNRMSTRPIDSLRLVEEKSGQTRKIDVYIYVPNQDGQSIIMFENMEDVNSSWKVTIPDQFPWVTQYTGTGQTTVSKASDATDWTNLSTSFGSVEGRPMRYKKVNGIVTITGSVANVTNITRFATLPVGFRPPQSVVFSAFDQTGAKAIELTIWDNGELSFNHAATNATVHITATFMI